MALSGWANGNYIEHGSAAALDDMSVGTIAFWFQTDSSTTRQTPFSKSANRRMQFLENDVGNPVNFSVTRATTELIVEAPSANFANYGTGKRLFAVATWDLASSANCKLYLGDLSNTAAEPSSYTTQTAGSGAATTDAASNWRIGRASATNREWVGPIDTHWVFNKVLSAGELANLQWAGRIGDWASCLIYTEYGWAGATATQPDWSGNGNNGTVTGTPTVADHVPKRQPFGFDLGWQGAFTAAAAGRTTKNTRSWTLGTQAGMGFTMPV